MTQQHGTGPKRSTHFLPGVNLRSVLIFGGDLIEMRYPKTKHKKGTMFTVLPIRDTETNMRAIHTVAEEQGVPASELVRRVMRDYCGKQGYVTENVTITPGRKKSAPVETTTKPTTKKAKK